MNHEDCPLSTVLDTNERYEVLHVHFDQYDQPGHVRIKGHPVPGADGSRYVGEEIIRLARVAEPDCGEQKLIGRPVSLANCSDTSAAPLPAASVGGVDGWTRPTAARFIWTGSVSCRWPCRAAS
jgi:hypothetical protein